MYSISTSITAKDHLEMVPLTNTVSSCNNVGTTQQLLQHCSITATEAVRRRAIRYRYTEVGSAESGGRSSVIRESLNRQKVLASFQHVAFLV